MATLWDRQWGRPGALTLQVQQALFHQSMLVPTVSIVDDPGPTRIEWLAGIDHPSPDLGECLYSFTRLADSPTDAALSEFAERWGPLGICRHGMVSTHGECAPLDNRDRWWEHHTEQTAWSRDWWQGEGDIPQDEWTDKYWEPLVAYRYLVRRLAAMLRIISDLKRGRPTKRDDWSLVVLMQDGTNMDATFAQREWLPTEENIIYANQLVVRSPAEQQQLVCNGINQWLFEAGVYPAVTWSPQESSLNLVIGKPIVPPGDEMSKYVWHGTSLYGVLIAQLAALAASNGEMTTCTVCGQPYKPLRKIRADRPGHYCSPECRGKAHKAIDREYQRAKRAASS